MTEFSIPIGGFNPLTDEPDDPVAAEEAERAEETTLIEDRYRRVFGSADGQVVLNHLKSCVYHHPGFEPAMGFYEGAAYGFAKQGQAAFIKFIEDQMKASAERN